jgi:hypothetical protein
VSRSYSGSTEDPAASASPRLNTSFSPWSSGSAEVVSLSFPFSFFFFSHLNKYVFASVLLFFNVVLREQNRRGCRV